MKCRSDTLSFPLLMAFLLALTTASTMVTAGTASERTTNGLTVYLGVLPAAMIQGHDPEHTEATMHGGVPSGVHAYHVMIAVFETESGERIEDATVEAEVTPLGLAGTRRRLEPMIIAGATTYGNHFTMRWDGQYKVAIAVTTTEFAEPVTFEFTYEHRTR